MNAENALEKAMDANRQQRNRLLEESIEDQSGLADGLAPFRNIPIKVYLTRPGLIKEISRNTNAISTVMRDTTGYLIFIDKEGDSKIKLIAGNLTGRFLVLHEYAHIIHGDVFEDKDNAEKLKVITFTLSELNKYWKPAEKFANKYAAERIRSEFIYQNDVATCQKLPRGKKLNGWTFPCEKPYLPQYPLIS